MEPVKLFTMTSRAKYMLSLEEIGCRSTVCKLVMGPKRTCKAESREATASS